MSKSEIQAQALDRARNGQSLTNYPSIYEGFAAKGIAESDIKPRENVLTFNAWKAVGRSVKKGEHGVKVFTYVEMTTRDASESGEESVRTYRRPSSTTVFHISQTEPSRF
jgi:antirestriction protein ArdC